MAKALRILALITLIAILQGCAALWVADKTVETAWFATKTTAKVGMTAAEVTWDAGSAVAGAAAGDDSPEDETEDTAAKSGEPDD